MTTEDHKNQLEAVLCIISSPCYLDELNAAYDELQSVIDELKVVPTKKKRGKRCLKNHSG